MAYICGIMPRTIFTTSACEAPSAAARAAASTMMPSAAEVVCVSSTMMRWRPIKPDDAWRTTSPMSKQRARAVDADDAVGRLAQPGEHLLHLGDARRLHGAALAVLLRAGA